MGIAPEKLFSLFATEGEFRSCTPFGSGHIHDTFRVDTRDPATPDYILQRINDVVFRDVTGLQGNIMTVTRHIRGKLMSVPGSDHQRRCLTPIATREGRSWHTAPDGSHWRMFLYITNHRSYDIVDTEQKAYEGGRAIGQFTAMLADLPGESVTETIPDFHNTVRRIETFRRSLLADSAGRVSGVRAETGKILDRADKMSSIIRLGEQGLIPLRITHNDTKFNNVLLDDDDKALCVIDLDTVMPGYVHYDFGDAIRTAASTATEDAEDLTTVALSLPLYRAWTRGFLSETNAILTPAEKEWLPFAPQLITYEQALRFLTDYIDGDIYYKISHSGHNLQRARTQLRLLESMEENYSAMEAIVREFS
ncbi:MAG: aminoglycoside phosphotransferase family protein [Bacteroidales bacterium]|nr:aminoglycoside phosphotransferase family protein [Bacteroidales bacterium]